VCPLLAAPDNGDTDCSLEVYNPGDTCTFTCDDDYELGGSTSRKCGDDGSWSGIETSCTFGMFHLLHFMAACTIKYV